LRPNGESRSPAVRFEESGKKRGWREAVVAATHAHLSFGENCLTVGKIKGK
jgi:hypothetical protein